MTQKLYKGDTLGRKLTFKDENDNAFDPSTITVEMINPSGTVVATLTLSDLTKVATGQYKFTWNIPSDAELGLWVIRVTATHTAGNLQNREEFTFIVEES